MYGFFTYSASCLKDYVQIFYGVSTSDSDLAQFSSNGKLCKRYYDTYYVYTNLITVRYHTDGSNSGGSVRGLRVSYEARGM